MNSFERVSAAFSFREPDRVPVYPILSGVTRNLSGATYEQWSTDAETCANCLLLAAEKFEQDCIVTLIDLSIECTAWGQELIFPENEAARPDYSKRIIESIDDYAKIKKVDFQKCERMNMHIEVCKKLVAGVNGEKPIVAFVFGPLGVLSMLRGQADMYMDLYDDPDAVAEAAREINETLFDYIGALIDTGVSAVMLDTLFASGSIMSKQMWTQMEGGLVRELSEQIRARGAMVMIHNCGQNIYFDAQIETMNPVAISFLYPPDDCETFAECKEKYGKKVALIGCVTPATAVLGSKEEWADECRSCIDAMAAGGGFMLATGCEYPANAGFERAAEMVELAKTYGKYKQ